MRRAILSIMLLTAIAATAQTQINPVTQVNWTAITGTTAPTQYCPTSTTGSTVNGSTSITVASTTGILVNQVIAGSGIPTGATAVGLSSATRTVTLSTAATATASGVSLTFSSYGMPYTNTVTGTSYTCSAAGWSAGSYPGVTSNGSNGLNVAGTIAAGTSMPTGGPSSGVAANVLYSPNEALNIRAFGALGVAGHDDSTAFLAALAQAYTTGGKIYCPPGYYTISQPIVIPNDGNATWPQQHSITIYGDGASYGFPGATAMPQSSCVLNLTYAPSSTVSSTLPSGSTSVSVASVPSAAVVGGMITIPGAGPSGVNTLYTTISTINSGTTTITIPTPTITQIPSGYPVYSNNIIVANTSGITTAGSTSIVLTTVTGLTTSQRIGLFGGGALATPSSYHGDITAISGTTLTITPATSAQVASGTVAYFGAKIQSTASGTFTISNVNLTDTGTDKEPFLIDTGTTFKFLENAIYATGPGSDVLFLGTPTHQFSGYGATEIIGNSTLNSDAFVTLNTDANSVRIQNNSITGSGYTPFNLLNSGGITLANNLVEVDNYQFGVVQNTSYGNTIIYNDMYDPTNTTICDYWWGGTAAEVTTFKPGRIDYATACLYGGVSGAYGLNAPENSVNTFANPLPGSNYYNTGFDVYNGSIALGQPAASYAADGVRLIQNGGGGGGLPNISLLSNVNESSLDLAANGTYGGTIYLYAPYTAMYGASYVRLSAGTNMLQIGVIGGHVTGAVQSALLIGGGYSGAPWTLGSGAGTSPGSPSCTPSGTCQSMGGTATFTSGTAPPTTGVLATYTTGITRSGNPNCTSQVRLATSPYTLVDTAPISTTTTVTVNLTGTALMASTAYTMQVLCILGQ